MTSFVIHGRGNFSLENVVIPQMRGFPHPKAAYSTHSRNSLSSNWMKIIHYTIRTTEALVVIHPPLFGSGSKV